MSNKTKLVIMAVCAAGLIAVMMTSCKSRSGRLKDTKKVAKVELNINSRVLAKLRRIDAVNMTTFAGEHAGDIVVKYVHPLYNKGEVIRILEVEYEILEVYPNTTTVLDSIK